MHTSTDKCHCVLKLKYHAFVIRILRETICICICTIHFRDSENMWFKVQSTGVQSELMFVGFESISSSISKHVLYVQLASSSSLRSNVWVSVLVHSGYLVYSDVEIIGGFVILLGTLPYLCIVTPLEYVEHLFGYEMCYFLLLIGIRSKVCLKS